MENIYSVLVNKANPIGEDFLSYVTLVPAKGTKNRTFLLEAQTHKAYLALAEHIKKEEGIVIALGNGYRSLADQKAIYDRFCGEFGKDYADAVVAPVGCSEHHTGLGADLELYFEGEGFISNNKNFERICPIFERHVHPHLAAFGFILRYPRGKEAITGYPYEPWHIRYVGCDIAQSIAQRNITQEEYFK